MLHLPCFLWNLWVKSAECTKNDPFIKFLFSLCNWLTHHRSPQGHIAQRGVSRMREQSGFRRGNKDSAFVWVCRLPQLVSLSCVGKNLPKQICFLVCSVHTPGVVTAKETSRLSAGPTECLNANVATARGRAEGGEDCSDNLDPSAVCLRACWHNQACDTEWRWICRVREKPHGARSLSSTKGRSAGGMQGVGEGGQVI